MACELAKFSSSSSLERRTISSSAKTSSLKASFGWLIWSLLFRKPYFAPLGVTLGVLTASDLNSYGTVVVKIKFTFRFRSTVRNVPFHLYGFFRSYVRTIADSAITGFERNE